MAYEAYKASNAETRHNPFSIQVYYYKPDAKFSLSFYSGHNPFSIQVYYYWLMMRALCTASDPSVSHNPFSIQVYYYLTVRRLRQMLAQIWSQSLFNSGLLLRYRAKTLGKMIDNQSQSLFNSGLLLQRINHVRFQRFRAWSQSLFNSGLLLRR